MPENMVGGSAISGWGLNSELTHCIDGNTKHMLVPTKYALLAMLLYYTILYCTSDKLTDTYKPQHNQL